MAAGKPAPPRRSVGTPLRMAAARDGVTPLREGSRLERVLHLPFRARLRRRRSKLAGIVVGATMSVPSAHVPKRLFAASKRARRAIRVSPIVIEAATLDAAALYARLATRAEGLTTSEGEARLLEHGHNVLEQDRRPAFAKLLWRASLDPLVILLAVLATISAVTGDQRSSVVMVAMIALSLGLKLVQETKAESAAAKLKAMIAVNATVLRDGAPHEIPVSHLVPGDVVKLAAGDMIPGDVRILHAKDLFVNQGSLTGESLPVEKYDVERHPAPPTAAAATPGASPLELTSIAFQGTSVESGSCGRGRARDWQRHLPRRHGGSPQRGSAAHRVRPRNLAFHVAHASVHGASWCRSSSSSTV